VPLGRRFRLLVLVPATRTGGHRRGLPCALAVLEHAAPTRVVPAYRLRTPAVPSTAGPLAAVALSRKRAQLRRRRRDALSVLVGAVLVTMAAALLTRSALAFAVQVMCDLALASYVSLLVRAARASGGAAPERRNAVAVRPSALDPGWSRGYSGPPVAEVPVRLRAELPEVAAPAPVTRYVPAHALRQVDLRVVTNEADDLAGASYAEESYGEESYGDESYGDFDSYASLALATAR